MTIKNSINLHSLFSYDEFKKAFSRLKKKNRFRQTSIDFGSKNRYSGHSTLNSLGKFILKHSDAGFSGLYESLNSYSLKPYHGIAILKKNGKYRPLLVPTPIDRVVFLAALPRIKKVVYERLLKYSALGVGVKDEKHLKPTTVSSKIFDKIKDKKTRYVLALDFQDFFSTIRRDKLRDKLKRVFSKTNEKDLLNLLVLSINNPIESDDLFKEKFEHLNLDKSGIPQGLAYSPLLASFFATSLDALVTQEISVTSYRYLDDMIIIGSNRRNLLRIYRKIKKYSAKLGLKLHELGEKTKILPVILSTDSFDFLGISFSKNSKRIPDSAIEKFMRIVKTEILTSQGLKVSSDRVKTVFREYVMGWKQYYSSICPEHYQEIKPRLVADIKTHMLKKRDWKRLYFNDEKLFSLS